MVSTEAAGMKKIMKVVATAPSANAIGMPVNITSSVATPYSNPMAPVLIAAAA